MKNLFIFIAITTFVFNAHAQRTTKQQKIVVLSFDDAVKTHYTTVAPILKKYHFNATFFVCEFPDGFEDTTRYMSWKNIQQLSQWGFDIGNHTWHHQNMDIDDKEMMDHEVGYIERKCDTLHIPRPISFAYPAYHTSDLALKILKDHRYIFARTGGDKPYYPKTDDPLLQPSFTPGDDFDKYKNAIDQVSDSAIIIFTIHGVPDTVHPWVNTSVETFTKACAYLKQQHITVISMRELAHYLRKDKNNKK